MKIILKNLQKKIPLNQKIINRALKKLNEIWLFNNYCFLVSLVSDNQIKKINKIYHKNNQPTDVLSFDISLAKNLSGDVIISVDTAKRNAKIYNNTIEKEILLYVIHGILHLTGFDDVTRPKAKIMQQKQEQILKKIWQ